MMLNKIIHFLFFKVKRKSDIEKKKPIYEEVRVLTSHQTF